MPRPSRKVNAVTNLTMTEPSTLPRHPPMTQFPVVDNCLQIGGHSLPALAEKVGQTPFYAYDAGVIRRRIDDLRRHLPNDLSLHYAVKANPMSQLVGFIATLIDGLDVASGGELEVALAHTLPPASISFAGPGKRIPELTAALRAGVSVHIESRRELESLLSLSRELGVTARVGVRVNPDFELKSTGLRMGGGPKPFGIDAELVPEVLELITGADLDFTGFHVFAGSQCLSAEALRDVHQQIFELVYRLADCLEKPPQNVNIGGGLGIPYFPGDQDLDLAALGGYLEELMTETRARLPGSQVIMELGRYLVGEAGIYVCRVVDKKISRGHTFFVTDGGMNHHLAASGNFGQVLRKNYPVVIGNRIAGEHRERVSIVGPLCTPLDLLADDIEVPISEVGDLVVVHQSGAYGLSASPTGFLSHPPPQEILVGVD